MPSPALTRRSLLQTAAGVGAASLLTRSGQAAEETPVAKHGRIKQSLVNWCYNKTWPDINEFAQIALKLGCQSIELIPPEHWPALQGHGLTVAIASSGHSFRQGPNHKENWDFVREKLTGTIKACAAHGVQRVITFTGFADGLSKEEGADNCVAFFREFVKFAEDQGVTICLEMLNTRDDTHPMKGHPGYQGDDTEYCIDIIERVDSAHFKLLFDIYHVQIMNGDVIRRIRQHAKHLGHIHTAGNPGRGELDESQEINYPAVMQALLDVGYDGYVGQEFIPTRDPWEGLKQAVALCDV